MKAKSFVICMALSLVFIIAETCNGQKVAVTGDSNQDVLKIPIEEVRIPVFAFDERGRFDTQLSVGDLLIREDGIAQNVRGVYRVPAYVLLLVDTGGEVNLLKTARLTADVAVEFVSKLRPEDTVSVMQVNSKVEVISDWSRNRRDAIQSIRTKLLPGKYSPVTLFRAVRAHYLKDPGFVWQSNLLLIVVGLLLIAGIWGYAQTRLRTTFSALAVNRG